MKWFLPLVAACVPCSVFAQSLPVPDPVNPRIQTFSWASGATLELTTLPMTGLTVMLEPGEQIAQISFDRRGAFDAHVSSEGDSFILVPIAVNARANIFVDTDRRNYRFSAKSGTGIMAAYLVRYVSPDLMAGISPQPIADAMFLQPDPTSEIWSYRLRGDRSVRPAEISDDGQKTTIRFSQSQAIPAIFAIGPSGNEQVVNGHMRGDAFIIDKVWQQLIFRIDREKATARRNRTSDNKND